MVEAAIAAGSALIGSSPSWLPWVIGGAGAAAGASSLLTGSEKSQTAAPSINLPKPSAPAKLPQQKPAQKTTGQQSFLAGAAQAQQAAATSTSNQGKTLLGA